MESNKEHEDQMNQPGQEVSEKTALTPIYTRQVDFHGDEITVVLVEERGQRQVYVLLRPLCTYMGLSWSSQLQRLREDEVLSEATTSVLLSNTESGHRQRYTMIALQLEYLPGWIFSFTPKRVRKDLQEKIKRYRKDCYRVLWQAFVRGELFPFDESLVVEAAAPTVIQAHDTRIVALDEQIETLSAVVALMQEHKAALLAESNGSTLAVVVAGQQELLTRTDIISSQLDYVVGLLELLVGRQDTTEQKVIKIDERTAHLTPAHAKYVHDMVDRIVGAIDRRAPGGTLNYARVYAQVYGRFKRYFNVPKYDQVADERFEQVKAWLQEELRRVSAGSDRPEQTTLF
jgi:hypothetical protein